MFYQRKNDVENQMKELQTVLDFITFKCWYYDTVCNDKTEDKITIERMPDNIRKLYEENH